MKIVESLPEYKDVITFNDAKKKVERQINNTGKDYLFVIKYEGKLISISGEYYKFAWKELGYLRNALTNTFGKELSEALVENGIIEVVKVYIS